MCVKYVLYPTFYISVYKNELNNKCNDLSFKCLKVNENKHYHGNLNVGLYFSRSLIVMLINLFDI